MPLSSQWPTWDLRSPPSGEDGRRWSARWFKPNGVNAWARRRPEVAAAVEKLKAMEGCWNVVVAPAGGDKTHLHLVVIGSLERSEVYEKPTTPIGISRTQPVAAQIASVLALTGPEAPIDQESARRNRAARRSTAPADSDERARAQDSLLAIQTIRRLGSQDLKNVAGVPLRRRLLKHVVHEVAYRAPRQQSPVFTDMASAELLRVVGEAKLLVQAFRQAELFPESYREAPRSFWPLLPNEADWIRRPPPIRHTPPDYDDNLKDPDDAASMRPDDVLAHDLTLMRLGYDPANPKARSSLNSELSRAR